MMNWVTQLAADAIVKSSEIGFTGPTTEGNIVRNALFTAYFWAGLITVGIVVYGGYLYVLANGDAGKVKKAKETLMYSLIGLVVVLLASAITNLVLTGVNGS